MSKSRGRILQSCALLAVAGMGRLAMAENPSEPFTLDSGTVTPIYAQAGSLPPPSTPEEQKALGGMLSHSPIGKTLQDAHISVYGWIEGSYQYSWNIPRHTFNNARIFDLTENNKGLLNQIDLTVEKTVDPMAKAWDVGGRMDLVYGSDSRFTVSSGLLDRQASFGNEAWFDVHQAYIDITAPCGGRLRIGKFEFFKSMDPNANVFYTHPFEYGNAFPFTLTGISGYYPLSKGVSIEGGVSRGWDQSLRDNNGTIDGFGRLSVDINERTKFLLSAITGPEQFHDNVYFTTAVDATLMLAPSDNLILLIDAIYGHQSHAQFGSFPGRGAPGGFPTSQFANWYGVNGTASFKINDMCSFNIRGEWYRDEEGFTIVGAPMGVNLYEATAGLSIMPLHNSPIGDNFIVRPEIRYDYASRAIFAVPATAGRHDQWTVAIDAIFNF